MDQLYQDLNESLESDFRHQALDELILGQVGGRKVLDVGCGSGILVKKLLE